MTKGVEDGTQCKTVLTFSNTRCRLLEGHIGDHVGKLTDMAVGVEDGMGDEQTRGNPRQRAPLYGFKSEEEYRAWQKKYHQEQVKNNPEVKARRREQLAQYRKSPEGRAKARAREATKRALKKGSLVRLPCVECGNPESHTHHTDYSKPLEVTWLCREHHMLQHRKKRAVQ